MASLFPYAPASSTIRPRGKATHGAAADRDFSFKAPGSDGRTGGGKAGRRASVPLVPGKGRRKLRGEGPPLLPVLYDDDFGTTGVKDYFDRAREITKPDGGPPRWFCPVECGKPVDDAPLLLFLPGLDGTGMGLILHHKPLGKVFEVRCLHIPVNDRTSFEGLVAFVEHTIQNEYSAPQNKPIYLLGDSIGGCLALAIAARNPTIDLILILSNPATSFENSQLLPLLPILEALPNELHVSVPYLLSFIMGDPVKLAMANIANGPSPLDTLDELSRALTSLLFRISDIADIIPKEAFLWKIKLVQSAALYANSRLHAVNAEVLVLTSGKDNMLPSKDEGQRLLNSLKNCTVRYLKDNGHTLLLEDGLNLMTIIKALRMYRRSRKHDYARDFLPPSLMEYKKTFEEDNRLFGMAASPVLLSTLRNGDIVRGLSGVPNEGPVLLVGYHMLMGIELVPLYEAFLREKRVCLRGMAHPILFSNDVRTAQQEVSAPDLMKVFGAVPVSPISMYKLFSNNEFVLLYPGGVREALHRKGEEYNLFWPEKPEFVRMAAQFGVTIVPFGAVGEDDITELLLDYNDQISIPVIRESIRDMNRNIANLRSDLGGDVSQQDLYFPVMLPKIPGRMYYLFGKPIDTKGMRETLKERRHTHALYLQIKYEVENILSYLKKKREDDPYRGILRRTIYQTLQGSEDNIPTFEP